MHYHKLVSGTAWRAIVPERWTPSIQIADVIDESEWHPVPHGRTGQPRSLDAAETPGQDGKPQHSPSRRDGHARAACTEAQRIEGRVPVVTCMDWVLRLKARYLSGDYAEAYAAADNAKALLWISASPVRLLDYVYYAALAVAALYETASADQQIGWHALLTEHHDRLRRWADGDPTTFADKHALVAAEIARIEGRDRHAMRLYEQAIQSARAHGFVQNEGVANELAARFYTACGVEKIAEAHLRDARHCHVRCGALGKVRQLDERHPWLRQEQAASWPTISLENATLHGELRRNAAMLAEGQRISRTGAWTWHVPTGQLVWSEEHYRLLGFAPAAVPPTWQAFLGQVHPDDQDVVQRALAAASHDGSGFAVEFRIALPDGSTRHLHSEARPLLAGAGGTEEFIGTTMDITERKQSEEALRNARADLARMARLTTMGELATSIVHEINQPLSAIVTNANACTRWLSNDRPSPDEAREAAERIVRDGLRASEIIRSVRALASKTGPEMQLLDINEVVHEALVMMRSEVYRHDVSIETDLSDNLAPVRGDRVQLQQVILNLMMNGVEAMSTVTSQPRVLRLRSEAGEPGTLRVAVEDSGPGLAPEIADSVFDAFFTTKPNGTGMGLSICRSIINVHGGRLWASSRSPRGAVFQFAMPVAAGVPA